MNPQSIPIGERLENPDAYPVAFADCGRVFWRGYDNYFRWWPIPMAEILADRFAAHGWSDLVEPLREAIKTAESYTFEEEDA